MPVDSNSRGFQAPQIPKQSARDRMQGPKAAIKTITKTVAKPTANTSKPQLEKDVFEKNETVVQRQSQNAQDLRRGAAANRKHLDSFQKKISTPNEQATSKNLSQAVSLNKKDKELKQQAAKNFVQQMNHQGLAKAKSQVPSTDKPEVQQNHQVVAQAVQSQDDVGANQKQAKKKTKIPLDAKLEKIYTLGADRGKKFVAFVQRELAKGPLSESMLELVDDFYSTLKGDSLSAADLLKAGEENLNLVRTMVSSDNDSELSSIQDALARSVTNSAGERADLLSLRNLQKNTQREAPPSPLQEIKKTPTERAIEFVASINLGTIKAPWDQYLLTA